MTPYQHRTRLGASAGRSNHSQTTSFSRSNGIGNGMSMGMGMGGGQSHAQSHGQTPRIRRPLGPVSGNSGYGLSAGMRAVSMQGQGQGQGQSFDS